MSEKRDFGVGALVGLSTFGKEYYTCDKSWTALIIEYGVGESGLFLKVLDCDERISILTKDIMYRFEVLS